MKYPNPSTYDKPIKLYKDKTLGYVYFFDKEHPLASKRGRVYYHRHVYSVKVNKWVDSSYIIHHKDTVRHNNHPDNLEKKSSGMHFRGHHKEIGNNYKKIIICENKTCGKKFTSSMNTNFCSIECMALFNRRFDVSKEELEKLVWKMPTTHIAKMFNVSDVAVGKRCKLFKIKKPPRGYWAKFKSKQ